jgi:NAD(P)H dehydrogenase (quinone)
MVKVLVCYYSRSGHTKRMAEEIAQACEQAGGEVDLLQVEQVDIMSMREYDCIILGSPTYYGTMAAPAKELIDKSVKNHGKLKGRVGGAFTSSGHRAGGNETTVIDILKAWLIHGMVVEGEAGDDHYAPVGIGAPDEATLKSCAKYGAKLTELAKTLKG